MRLSRGVGSQLVFLSPVGVAGSLVLCFSQIFAWVFLPLIDVAGLWEWRGPVERASGRVVAVEPTSATVDGRRVMAVRFEHDGRSGVSYTTAPGALSAGAPVEIELPAGKPDRGRIAGMSRSEFPSWTLLPILPPLLAGVILLAIAALKARRRRRVLERGELAPAELVEKTATLVRVNRRRVHRHRYRFTARDGRSGAAMARSHRDLPAASEVVYDPETLDAVVVAALPGPLAIEPGGQVIATRPRTTLLLAALSALGVAGWIVALLVRLG